MLKGFTKHEVKKIEVESDLDRDFESFKQIKGNNTLKKVNSNTSVLNFMNKSEIEKELIRVHLKESAHKIIIE